MSSTTERNANRLWVWILLILLALAIGIAVYFFIQAQKADEKYNYELTNRYRLNATDSILRYQVSASQKRGDSLEQLYSKLLKSSDSLNKADNDIRNKYDGIYKDINTASGVDSQVRIAMRLLAINRKLSLEGK